MTGGGGRRITLVSRTVLFRGRLPRRADLLPPFALRIVEGLERSIHRICWHGEHSRCVVYGAVCRNDLPAKTVALPALHQRESEGTAPDYKATETDFQSLRPIARNG